MARVTLLFEDVDNTIAFRADYQGGLDLTSPAHKLANQVIKFLDTQAAEKRDIQVDTEPTDTLQNGHGIDAEGAENIEAIRRMASAGEPLMRDVIRAGEKKIWLPGDH